MDMFVWICGGLHPANGIGIRFVRRVRIACGALITLRAAADSLVRRSWLKRTMRRVVLIHVGVMIITVIMRLPRLFGVLFGMIGMSVHRVLPGLAAAAAGFSLRRTHLRFAPAAARLRRCGYQLAGWLGSRSCCGARFDRLTDSALGGWASAAAGASLRGHGVFL
jgi:hypothetical protein